MATEVGGPDRAQYLDEQKLAFDFVKHITALDTGTIVLLAAFLRDTFPDPEWQALVPITFVSFVASTLALSGTALGLLASVRNPGDISAGLRSFTAGTALVGLAGFLLGLTCLSLFAVKNWI
jgi:hypothetical protein